MTPGQEILISFEGWFKSFDKRLEPAVGRFIRVNTSIAEDYKNLFLGIHGLLPPRVKSQEEQVDNCLRNRKSTLKVDAML